MTDTNAAATGTRTRFSLAEWLKASNYDPKKARAALTGAEWAYLPKLVQESTRLAREVATIQTRLDAVRQDMAPIIEKLDEAAAQ